MASTSNGFIPPHGGYQNIMSYQMAEIFLVRAGYLE